MPIPIINQPPRERMKPHPVLAPDRRFDDAALLFEQRHGVLPDFAVPR